MAILAYVLGILGGLCAVMGIVTATETVSLLAELPSAFSAIFWVELGVVLLLGCIAALLSRGAYE